MVATVIIVVAYLVYLLACYLDVHSSTKKHLEYVRERLGLAPQKPDGPTLTAV